MSVEDLKCVIQYHWMYDQKIYATERQRVQMSLFLLLSAFTTLRPKAILESGGAKGSNQALQYRDVVLMLVSNPTLGGQDLWVIKVTLVY